MSENFWVAPLLAGQTVDDIGDAYEGDVLGQSPRDTYALSAKQASEAAHEDGAIDMKVHLSYGDVPAEVYLSQRVLDLVIHDWDLAKATKQNTTLDAELVDAVTKIVEAQEEDLRNSGLFGNAIEVPADADPQTKLLAKLGRQA